jgi:DNA-binding MarR family transcriptional regulator
VARIRRTGGDSGTESILRHWQEAVPNDRLAHLVRDTARAYVRALQLRLTQHSVAFGHWAFLRILWEQDGLTQRQLSDQAGVMEPTTFSAINAMEKLGYLIRKQIPEDKRKQHIYLTPKGRMLKSKLVPLAEEVNRVGIQGIKPADIATTRKTLLAILESLAHDESASSNKEHRIPSTRELSKLVSNAGKAATRAKRRA